MAITVTAWKSPAVGASNNSAGNVAWTNPGNVLSSNDVRATATLAAGQTTHYLVAREFDFSEIPASAIIVGIEAAEEGRVITAGVLRVGLRLWLNGEPIGGARSVGAAQNITPEIVTLHGGLFDRWGAPLTPAMLKDAQFGVSTRFVNSVAENRTTGIDHIQMRAAWRLPGWESPDGRRGRGRGRDGHARLTGRKGQR